MRLLLLPFVLAALLGCRSDQKPSVTVDAAVVPRADAAPPEKPERAACLKFLERMRACKNELLTTVEKIVRAQNGTDRDVQKVKEFLEAGFAKSPQETCNHPEGVGDPKVDKCMQAAGCAAFSDCLLEDAIQIQK